MSSTVRTGAPVAALLALIVFTTAALAQTNPYSRVDPRCRRHR